MLYEHFDPTIVHYLSSYYWCVSSHDSEWQCWGPCDQIPFNLWGSIFFIKYRGAITNVPFDISLLARINLLTDRCAVFPRLSRCADLVAFVLRNKVLNHGKVQGDYDSFVVWSHFQKPLEFYEPQHLCKNTCFNPTVFYFLSQGTAPFCSVYKLLLACRQLNE